MVFPDSTRSARRKSKRAKVILKPNRLDGSGGASLEEGTPSDNSLKHHLNLFKERRKKESVKNTVAQPQILIEEVEVKRQYSSYHD